MCYKNKKSKNKNVHAIQQDSEPDSDENSYVHEIKASDDRNVWTQKLQVSCKERMLEPITFKLDTAADVTMVPVQVLSNVINELPLNESSNKVFSAKKQERFKILGTVKLKLKYKNREITENVFISEEIDVPLLSRKACQGLYLVKRIYSISTETNWVAEYSSLFQGLGNMEGEYKIEIKENAEPYAISVPRTVPVPLRDQVKEALEEMQRNGVIVPVDHATEWCAPMVVNIKKGGKGVRICVDLSRLNKSVKRQFHPIPVVELQLAEIRGAKYFSKLDANHGFWQLNLAEESRDYTTFLTPFGRFKFQKLPFGITSAPEEFQKRMSRVLEGAKNTLVHMDDVLVWGNTKEEHDDRLREVLERIKKHV